MPNDAFASGAALADKTASQEVSPLRVKGLDHVVLRVSDMDRAISFYEQVLGLHIERRLPEIGLVQLRAGSAMIDLVPQKEDEADGRNMDHYAVQIESMDVEALSAHLRRHGVDPGEARHRYGAEGYGSSIYISDPDGNTVELKGPPEPGQTIPGR
jgi:glyoxylase I family protein